MCCGDSGRDGIGNESGFVVSGASSKRDFMAKGSKQAGHQARKRFSQNFLEDDVVISQIVSGVNPRPGD